MSVADGRGVVKGETRPARATSCRISLDDARFRRQGAPLYDRINYLFEAAVAESSAPRLLFSLFSALCSPARLPEGVFSMKRMRVKRSWFVVLGIASSLAAGLWGLSGLVTMVNNGLPQPNEVV